MGKLHIRAQINTDFFSQKKLEFKRIVTKHLTLGYWCLEFGLSLCLETWDPEDVLFYQAIWPICDLNKLYNLSVTQLLIWKISHRSVIFKFLF